MANGFVQRFRGKIAARLIQIVSPLGQFLQSVQTPIVAHAGGGQANATPLTAMACFITTVVTAGDSVILPPSVPGMEISVINTTATATGPNCFPAVGEKINTLSTNAAIAIAPDTITMFYCGTAGQWWTK